MRTAKTPDLINQRLVELVKYTEDDLHSLTVPALRKLLTGVGVNVILRSSGEIPISSARKDELIEAVRKIAAPTKVIVTALPNIEPQDILSLNEIAEDDSEFTVERNYPGITEHYYEKLQEYVKGRFSIETQEWLPPDGTLSALAGGLAGHIERLYQNTKDLDGSLIDRYSTRLNCRGQILKNIQALVNKKDAGTWYYNQLVQAVADFKKFVLVFTKVDSDLKASNDKANDKVRASNRSQIDITRMLEFAHSVLADVSTLPSSRWKDVVLALVLCTGRRPFSEVMSTAQFTVVGEYELEFTGQAKAKGLSAEAYALSPSYRIPTLVPASLCYQALQWLVANGKQKQVQAFGGSEQKAREAANKAWSKDVAAQCKQLVSKYVDITIPSEQPKAITPHTFRELYALAACRAFGGTTNYDVTFAAAILGHSEVDRTTAIKYQQDFEISPHSVCKL